MNIGGIVSLIVLILTVISVVVRLVVITLKKNKLKDAADKANNVLQLLDDVIPAAMIFAEQVGGTPEAKKLIAVSKVIDECVAKDIDYTEISEAINDSIEKLIGFSKQVNSK